ncbi:DivIVA domain-containing protein [Pseudokineococcus sp. 1T1Z-3]|uniref:DivIVA domain-containing protein n=1 Tax=Pseudokineococcus sp. 1T1Z-3 TaxID=3132745 RepID=UPI00309B1052
MSDVLTAAELRSVHLPVRRWGSGYATAEVDALLEQAAATLDGSPERPLSAQQVASCVFTTVWRSSYDMDRVDDLLDRVVEALTAAGLVEPVAAPARHDGRAAATGPAAGGVTAHDLRHPDLPTAGFLAQGYAREEVDALLRRAASALTHQGASGPTLTADAVRASSFTLTRRGGYDVQAVDALLDRVVASLPSA